MRLMRENLSLRRPTSWPLGVGGALVAVGFVVAAG